jgi:hypothetical protein
MTFPGDIPDNTLQCRDEIGLVCFGTSPDNDILWQRYGGNGAGVCIELDVPEHLLESQLSRVQYADARTIHIDQLIRAFLDRAHVKDVYAVALLSKSCSWAAEAEIRFVSKMQALPVGCSPAETTLLQGLGLPPACAVGGCPLIAHQGAVRKANAGRRSCTPTTLVSKKRPDTVGQP